MVCIGMNRNFNEILSEVMTLDHESKIALADRLAVDIAMDEEHLQAWIKESRRRYEMIERGEMQTVDAKEALERIRKELFGA